MISGRGLGHTGGTLDKLEAIPGYQTSVSEDDFQNIVTKVGCAIVGAGEGIAPADKRLYAIRDITSTVESIDLITASILSKKLAAGLEGLVLDVKIGNGAFISDPSDARILARSLVNGAKGTGCKTAALLTDMEQPLAPVAGNSLEIKNALEFLCGLKDFPRLREVTVALGGQLLTLGGLASDAKEGEGNIVQALTDGRAAECFARMVSALGGPTDLLDNFSKRLPQASFVTDLHATESGFISEINVRALGHAVIELGGGRKQQDDILDLSVGLDQMAERGQAVSSGDLLCRIHAKDEKSAHSVSKIIQSSFTLSEGQPRQIPLVGELLD
jgi:thymidine phosphorylase